jgi:hypothetical protein
MTILLAAFAPALKMEHLQVKKTEMLGPEQVLSIARAMKRTLQLVSDK